MASAEAVALILGSWLVAGAAVVGLGLLLRRLLGVLTISVEGAFAGFWCGYAALLGILQIWHLARPIDGLVFPTVALLATIGFWLERHSATRTFAGKASLPRWAVILALIYLVWLAKRASGMPISWDSGYYHVPTVRWIESFPIVRGLGNLEFGFGFNTASLLFVALLDHGPLAHQANHVATSLLLAVIGLQVILAAVRLLRTHERLWPSDLFMLLAAPAFAHLATDIQFSDVASPTTDAPSAILAIVTIRTLVQLVTDDERDMPRSKQLVFVALLASATMSVKMSAAVLVLGAICLALIACASSIRSSRLARLDAARAIVLAGLLVGPWMVRSTVLTGYPLYPLKFLSVPVDWRVPEETMGRVSTWIQVFGRSYKNVHFDSLDSADLVTPRPWVRDWLRSVFKNAKGEIVLPFALFLVAGLGLILAGRWRERLRSYRWLAACLLAPAAGLIFWFAFAPAPRFAHASTWSLAIITCVLAIAPHWSGFSTGQLKAVLAIAPALSIALVSMRAVGVYRTADPGRRFDAVRPLIWNAPGPDHGLYPYPTARLSTRTLPSGLVVLSPVDDERVWEAPLPSSARPPPGLALREPGSLAGGFCVAETE